MTSALQIKPFESDHILPLHEDSQGQEGPAYLYLDTRDGDVYLKGIHPAYASSWGQDEQNGHVRRWNVPNNLTVAGINQLLTDADVLKKFETVMGGAEEYYDGSNYRTRLSEQAAEASEGLEQYLNDTNYHRLETWDAAMWLSGAHYPDLVKDGESHESAAERLQQEAIRDGIYCSLINLELTLDSKKEDADENEVAA